MTDYVKNQWLDGTITSPYGGLSATRLSHMEDGIFTAQQTADTALAAGGTPGSVWREGTGAPSNSLGINGDFYLDGATGNVYQKASGTYSVVTNILGPAGAAGPTGPPGPALSPGTNRKYANLTGSNMGYTAPDHAAFDVTTADMRALVRITNWATGATQVLGGKWTDTATGRQYKLQISSTGQLAALYSTTGANTLTITAPTNPMGQVLGPFNGELWCRAVLQSNDGTGKAKATFYISFDAVTWFLLGSATNATPGPFNSGDGLPTVGAHSNGTTSPVTAGRVEMFEIWDATPTLISRLDVRALATNSSTFTDAVGTAGSVWTPKASVSLGNDEINGQDMLAQSVPKDRIAPDMYTLNAREWGIKGDGVTDDTTAINALFAAATPSNYGSDYELGSRTIRFPAGVYAISSQIQKPNHIDIVGDGSRVTVFKCTTSTAGLFFGVPGSFTTGASHTGGVSRGFFVDGNNVSTQPFIVGRIQGYEFNDIEVRYSVGTGAYLAAGQNNLFTQCAFIANAGDGAQLDLGWGGNVFVRCQFSGNGTLGGTPSSRSGYYNIKIWETAASGSIYNEPSNNNFYGCIIERAGDVGAAGDIYIGAATNTRFTDCDISMTVTTLTQKAAVTLRLDNVNGSTKCSNIRFTNCFNSGTQSGAGTGSVWLDAAGAVTAWFLGRTNFQSADLIWRVDDNAQIYVDPAVYGAAANYDALFANGAGGTKTFSQCVRRLGTAAQIAGTPTDTNFTSFFGRTAIDGDTAYDITNHHYYVRSNGAWVQLI